MRGGDPMKTRSQKRKEKKAKIAKTGRAIRLKKRLGRIHKKKCEVQQDTHMIAIMEAYIRKRKEERRLEKEKEKQAESSGKPTVESHKQEGATEQKVETTRASGTLSRSSTGRASLNGSRLHNSTSSKPFRGAHNEVRKGSGDGGPRQQGFHDQQRVRGRSLY